MVIIQIENETKRDASKVFSTYADVDEGFIVTRIPVFETCLDRDPVVRSQARIMCGRLDSFEEAVLDIDKVEIKGQRMYLYTINNKVEPVKYGD